ncbi:MAG: hypothetical protein WAP55_01710 [Minisyncoccia bacterium]
MINSVTIPKNMVEKGDLVIIPRKEYEEFLSFRLKKTREVELTPAQKKALKEARKNLARGKFLTIHELKRKLGIESGR